MHTLQTFGEILESLEMLAQTAQEAGQEADRLAQTAQAIAEQLLNAQSDWQVATAILVEATQALSERCCADTLDMTMPIIVTYKSMSGQWHREEYADAIDMIATYEDKYGGIENYLDLEPDEFHLSYHDDPHSAILMLAQHDRQHVLVRQGYQWEF